MRAAGLSLKQLALFVGVAALVVALVTLLLGEVVSPYTEEAAKGLRLKATSSIVAREFRSGFWVKDDRSFVNIQDVTPEYARGRYRIPGDGRLPGCDRRPGGAGKVPIGPCYLSDGMVEDPNGDQHEYPPSPSWGGSGPGSAKRQR